MLQSLKRRALQRTIPVMLVLVLFLVGLLIPYGADFLHVITGAEAFDPSAANDVASLEGRYLEINIDTLIDYYAQTVSSSNTLKSREYLMPFTTADGDVAYIGVEVPASKVDDADAVVDDTIRMLDDTDGSYQWDGSYVSVRGTVKAMDAETAQLYREYFDGTSVSSSDIGRGEGYTFQTLVLVDGTIGHFDSMGTVALFVLFWGAGFAALVWILIASVRGKYQDQITRYLAACPNPLGAEQQLDLLYEDTETAKNLHVSRSWLLCTAPLSPWVLAADDVVWAHQYTVTRKMYGILTTGKSVEVRVYSASEDAKHRLHSIAVKNEEAAHELLDLIHRTYPNAAIGWSEEMEKEYNANPAAFHRSVIASRQQAAEPAVPEATSES